MKSVIVAIGVACFGLSGCHHFHQANDPSILRDYSAIERFAIDAVYQAHPTRALVDTVEAQPNSDEGHSVLNIEMSGSPTARKIYAVHVSELDDGTLQLERLDTLQ